MKFACVMLQYEWHDLGHDGNLMLMLSFYVVAIGGSLFMHEKITHVFFFFFSFFFFVKMIILKLQFKLSLITGKKYTSALLGHGSTSFEPNGHLPD
jgi:Ni/Fe-hydrogenase subunit HybB-like protein